MNKKDILSFRKKIDDFLSVGRLNDAFKLIRAFSEQNMAWEMTDRIDALEKSYSFMISYALQGVADPERPKVYNDIIRSLHSIADALVRHSSLNDAPELYYNYLRYYKRVKDSATISELLQKYSDLLSSGSPFAEAIKENTENASDNLTVTKESIEKEIFNHIWTVFPLSEADTASLNNAILSDDLPVYFRRLLVSALLLALIAFYDERKLLLIMDAYCSDDDALSTTALVALLLALYVNRSKALSAKASARLDHLRQTPRWLSDIRLAYMELIRTRDTDAITAKMRDEIVPQMMKMAPKPGDNSPIKKIDITELEENPEWQEMLEKSGLADKIKELHELQEEGSDLFMGAFSHLKSYPFFSDISNWFLPFHIDRSEVKKLGDDNLLTQMLDSVAILCDSDKYSFVLSISSLPASQREMMINQMKAQSDEAAEMLKSSLQTSRSERKLLINKYVQNLYRFFNLFRRKGDFENIFASEINLTQIPSIAEDLSNDETLSLVAEFYFKRKYYAEAVNVFTLLEKSESPRADLFQKIAFCYQSLSDIPKALEYYKKAELLNPDSAWTLKRIALCLKTLNDYPQALDYLLRLEKLCPESISTLKMIGDCYLRLGKPKNALKAFYKANYLNENSIAVWRALAWTLMLDGQFEKALEYHLKVLSSEPIAEDHLNYGHQLLLQGDYSGALNSYKSSLVGEGADREAFIRQMNLDFQQLNPRLIKDNTVALIIDAVLYSSAT